MKKFLTYTLATITGIIVVNLLFFFLFMGMVGAMLTFDKEPVTVKENSILKIELKHNILDRATSSPLDNLELPGLISKSIGLNKILESIKGAASDSKIKGIYLNLTDIQSNFGALATIEEIRNALLEFKKSGKFIYSYSNMGYSQKSYYLATVSDSIFVNPETPLGLVGMGNNMVFYKNMLDKMGIKCEVIKVGKYKSAVEPFTQTEISEANREQIETYMRSLWGNILKGISATRNISVDNLDKLADNFDMRMPEEEKKFGLFDGVIYEDQMLDILKEKNNIDKNNNISFISLQDYQKALPADKQKVAKDKIAVIYASGNIGFESGNNSIGPELAESVRKARKDKNVKAIVLRVNSPGGSALTSDIIWRETKLAAETKPLIVSMGNVAASGGYYIACAADTIVASPTTLTGSIGVFGQFFTGEKLLKEKIGLTGSVVKTNKHGNFGGYYNLPLPVSSRSLTSYEKNVLQNYVEHTYEAFLQKVAEGRGMTTAQVNEVAQGRVWTGEDALRIGLVDVLGGLNDAIRIAAEKAGVEKYRITEYPAERNKFEELFGEFTTSLKTKFLEDELGAFYHTFATLKEMGNTQEGIVARLPYDLYID